MPTQPLPPPAADPAGAPPPGAPGPGGDVVAADQQAAAEKQAMIMQTVPQPSGKGYNIKGMTNLRDAINAAVTALTPEGMEPPFQSAFEPVGPQGEKVTSWEQPLPPDLYIPVVVIDRGVKETTGESKYDLRPEGMSDDKGVRHATTNLQRMSKDKKLIESMMGPPPEEQGAKEPAGPPPGPPQAMSPEEEELAASAG